ncbi:hypothetical protein [Lancefieldella rimae]
MSDITNVAGWPNVPDWVQSDIRGLILLVESAKKRADQRGEELSSKDFEEIVSHLRGLLDEA